MTWKLIHQCLLKFAYIPYREKITYNEKIILTSLFSFLIMQIMCLSWKLWSLCKRSHQLLFVFNKSTELGYNRMFVCLFVCLHGDFPPTWEFFTNIEMSSLSVKCCTFWLMLGIYGHWALSSDCFLVCHTYCVTAHGPFIIVISDDSWHSHLLPSIWQWSWHYLFKRLRSVAAGIWTPNLPLAGETLLLTVCHCCGPL